MEKVSMAVLGGSMLVEEFTYYIEWMTGWPEVLVDDLLGFTSRAIGPLLFH